MSTKIYNGYRISMMSFDKLHEFATGFMQTVRAVARTEANRRATWLAVELLDCLRLGEPLPQYAAETVGSSNDWTVQAVARHSSLNRIINARQQNQRDTEYDFDCSLTFIPLGKKILTLCYSEQFEHLWRAFPGVEEYGYWDNTDKPETVSNAAWRRRMKDWDAAIGDDAPCMRGFTIEAWGKYSGPMPEVTARLQPSLKQRAGEFARLRLSRQYDAESGKDLKSLSSSEFMAHYMGFRKWLGEHPDALTAAVADVSEALPRRWKQADFARVLDGSREP